MRLRSAKSVDRLIAATIAVLLISAWELASHRNAIDARLFPPPSKVAMTIVDLAHDDLFSNIGITLARFAGGLAIGALPGVLFGLVIGSTPRLLRIVDPFIAAIHPLPKLVLFPLFILIFGVNEWAKVASIALTVFFPSMINAAAGAREIAPLYFEVVRGYGGKRVDLLRHVVLPGSLPMILNGIRIASSLGLLVTIAIEFTGASTGIGSIIWLALQTMRIEQLYAGIVVISIIGIGINLPIQLLLRRTATWS